VNRLLIRLYRPIIAGVMRWKKLTIMLAALLAGGVDLPGPGSALEFMPTLNEGTLLYMPSSLPGMSITKAAELMQTQDKIIKSFPEVVGASARPAAPTRHRSGADRNVRNRDQPHPEQEWRPGMTTDTLIAELDRHCSFPASPTPGRCRSRPAPTCCPPASAHRSASRFSARIWMRWKSSPGEIEASSKRCRAPAAPLPNASPAASISNIEPDRSQLARYGLTVGEVQDVIGSALGGEMVTTTVEGRERFGVSVRYPRELRASPEQIAREVLVPTMGGAMLPLGQLAKVEVAKGTPGIRTENALLSAYIYVDIRDRDIGGYVAEAKKAVADTGEVSARLLRHLERPVRVHGARRRKMKIVIPITLLSIFLLLYLNFRRLTETLIVMLSVPFALVGGIWLMWLLDYNLSVAVAVGFIALAGVAAETGVVMLIYLDHAWEASQGSAAAQRTRARPCRDLYLKR
jgi:Cu(I)/Ag(I) efflux system membrane protein CusA/SilA